MDLQWTPTEWSVTYPVHPNDPIGHIRREVNDFHAWLRDEDLGLNPNGDAAVEAVWARFLEASAAQHDAASRTHGAYEQHG